MSAWVDEHLGQASPNQLRSMVKTLAEADAVCGAGYGQVSDQPVNRRNGYRDRQWDTRAGTIDLAVPRLRLRLRLRLRERISAVYCG